MKSSTLKSFSVALAIHAAGIAAMIMTGAGENEKSTSSSAQDPIMLMLGGGDATKDAGIVGRERGVARGTKDGDPLFDPGKYTAEALDQIRRDAEQSAREQEAREKAAAKQAAKARAEAAKKTEAAKKAPATKPAEASKPAAPAKPAESSSGKTVSVADFIKANKGKSGNKNSAPAKQKSATGAGGKRIGEVRVGGASGKNAFGTATGTGGNGGDGGSRVADERAIYAEAVSARFKDFFESVVASEPVALPNTTTVSARFSVDGDGNIKFIEVQGSTNPEIADRIKKAFARAFPSKFQRPPRGEGFVGRLENITFVVD